MSRVIINGIVCGLLAALGANLYDTAPGAALGFIAISAVLGAVTLYVWHAQRRRC